MSIAVNYRKYIVALIAAGLFVSCGKIYDHNGFDWQPDTPVSDSVYNREIQVLDLGEDNLLFGHRPVDVSDPIFFSLEKFSSVHLGYKASARWDIAYAYLGVRGNNGSRPGYGYGSSAVGGLVMLDSAYSQVTTVPDDSRFSAPGEIGVDIFAGNGLGFWLYTGFGNPFHPEKAAWADGTDEEKAIIGNQYLHMVYCLSEDLAKAYPGLNNGYYEVKPKTIIVRTANGNYAKLEMQSLYKGVTDPKEMLRDKRYPLGYASFRYMIIKAEEKRFGFVARRPPLKVDLTAKKISVE